MAGGIISAILLARGAGRFGFPVGDTARPITGLSTYFRQGVYPHTWNEELAYKMHGTPPP